VPPLCVLGGAAIIAGRTRPDPTRTVLGGVLGLVAVSGLAELAGGSPTFSSSHADLSAAGGVLGVAVGHSSSGRSHRRAAVVFVVVAIVAVLLRRHLVACPRPGHGSGERPRRTQPRALVGCGRGG